MKKLLLICLCTLLTGPSLLAQVKNSDFQKLFDLYTMEEYDRCAYKAEKMSQKDKYSRDPEPYLYMALCFYQAHVQPEKFDQEFDDPLKDALKYAYKFRKKDKTGELYESNRDLLDKIREEALFNAKFYYNDGEYRKAASEFRRILKVIPDDINVLFMSGVADIMAKNAGQGEKYARQALDTLRAQEGRDAWVRDDVTYDILISAFVGYTNYLADSGKSNDAQEIMTFARQLLPNDPSLKAHYKKIYSIGGDDDD